MSSKLQSDEQCQHVNSRGRRCRMLIADDRTTLCPHHFNLSKAENRQQDEAVAAELLGSIGDFSSAGSVNLFLGNLLSLLARKRIDRRDAMAQAYVCQLILNTFPAIDRQIEAEKEGADLSEFLLGNLLRRRENPPPDQYSTPDVAVPQTAQQ